MKYIFAVSGGPDSMAMLDMFHKKAQAVCVVNYNKRKNSQKDVDIVQNYCMLHNIKCYVHKVDSKYYEEFKNVNFQALAREIRYNFFIEIAHKENNFNLFVAHNLNDHLETAYMQFKRNSKSLFYGIARKSNYHELKITRPLLQYKKKTLERYCIQNGIEYAIDYTNEMDIYERNRVRKIINSWSNEELIKFNKEVKKYNKTHKKQYKQVKKQFELWTKTNYELTFFNATSSDLQYFLVYEFLKLFGEKNNNFDKINSIIDFLKSNKNAKKYRLENGKFLKKIDSQLRII